MSNPSKQKGTRWETELVNYLRTAGFPACERRALSGNSDRGDVAGIDGWTIEAKSATGINLAGWSDETERERLVNQDPWGLLVIKRRLKPASEAYAVMPMEAMAELMRMDQEGFH